MIRTKIVENRSSCYYFTYACEDGLSCLALPPMMSDFAAVITICAITVMLIGHSTRAVCYCCEEQCCVSEEQKKQWKQETLQKHIDKYGQLDDLIEELKSLEQDEFNKDKRNTLNKIIKEREDI